MFWNYLILWTHGIDYNKNSFANAFQGFKPQPLDTGPKSWPHKRAKEACTHRICDNIEDLEHIFENNCTDTDSDLFFDSEDESLWKFIIDRMMEIFNWFCVYLF